MRFITFSAVQLSQFKSVLLTLLLVLSLTYALPTIAASPSQQLLAEVEAMIEQTGSRTGVTQLAPAIRQALLEVPRDQFVPAKRRHSAWENRPLPIGYGQTISQPYIVALMTALLQPDPGYRVLEVGTGSGYQAAILSPLVAQVYSLEIIRPLAEQSSHRLQSLGFSNVSSRYGDGYFGWPEQAPFDAIIVTAAAGHIPPPLIEQLRPGGRMVIPVGGRFMTQQLMLVLKDEAGQVRTQHILPVRFVPLTGGQ